MRANRGAGKVISEFEKLKKEHKLLSDKYAAAEKTIQELQKLQETQKYQDELDHPIGTNHFRKTLLALNEETERLRTLQPIQDLLAAKELEIQSTSRALSALEKNHPQFEGYDLKLKTALLEREDLRNIGLASEEKFRRQILRIRTAGLMIPFEVETEGPKQVAAQSGDNQEDSGVKVQEWERGRNSHLSLLPIL